jgi:hypothetical protein
MKRILIASILTATVAGCSDDVMTDVDAAHKDAVAQSAVTADAAVASRADALSGIDDALDRIIPALTDKTTAHTLKSALSGLRTALANADDTGVPTLLDVARAAVERYALAELDAADLDAIRLGLDYARTATGA